MATNLGELTPAQSYNDLVFFNNSNLGVSSTLLSLYSGNGVILPIKFSASKVEINFNGANATKPVLDCNSVKFTDLGNKTGAVTISTASSNCQKITMTGNITLSITSDVTSGVYFELILLLQQSSGGQTITLGSGFVLTGNTSLTLSSGADDYDILKFVTVDGGTTWLVSNIGGSSSGGGSFSNPMTNDGDMIIQSSSVPARLAIGTNGQIMMSNGTIPVWHTLVSGDIPNLSASKITSGTLDLARGGMATDLSATGGTGYVFKQSTVGGTPTVAALVASDIPSLDAAKITTGQLALARGGTNADLSATGGTGKILRQSTVGAAITVATMAHSELTNLTTGDPHSTQYVSLSPIDYSRNIITAAGGVHNGLLILQQSDDGVEIDPGVEHGYFGVLKYSSSTAAWMLYNQDGLFTKIQQSVPLWMKANSAIRLYNTANTHYSSLQVASGLAADVTFQLPSTNGSDRNMLGGNGAGVISWVGINSETTPSQITSNQNNYSLGNTDQLGWFRLTSDQNGRTITGLSGGSAGREIKITNAGSYDIIFTHLDSNSTSTNQLYMVHELDMVLRPGDTWVIIYDNTSGYWRVVDGYQGYLADPMFVSEMHDDFVWGTNGNGTFGELGWSFNNSGSGTPFITAEETGYLGACKISSGTTGGGRGELVSNNPVNMSLPTGLIFEATVRFPILSATTNTTNAYTAIAGISYSMAVSGAVTSQHTMAFCYDRVGANANWKALTSNTSVTSTDTGVAVSTSYQRLKFVYNTAGTSCKFYINESLVATNTTNFPNSSPYAVKFGIWNLSGNTTSMVMYVENFKMRILRTTRRN